MSTLRVTVVVQSELQGSHLPPTPPHPEGGGGLGYPAGQSNVFKRKPFQSSALDFVTYVQSTSEQFNLVLPMHNDIDLTLSSKLNFKTKN